MQKPYGIALVVGPTGSGKTTTLHSALGFINTVDMKIWTAEDPVEITQRGLRQVQVHPKIDFTFAAAMRSFLRADPDVIMVGEMRDHETAAIGIEASLTGHLVFSTLHTNSAPETITRLLDMDIDPFNFADALLGIMAQRLIRVLCTKCKEGYNPTPEEFEEIIEVYGYDYWPSTGITYSPELMLYKPKGCPQCNNTGYKGRMGVHELLVGTDEMKKAIQNKATIERAAQPGHAAGDAHASAGRASRRRSRASPTSSRRERSQSNDHARSSGNRHRRRRSSAGGISGARARPRDWSAGRAVHGHGRNDRNRPEHCHGSAGGGCRAGRP